MMRGVTHTKKERKESVISIVKTDVNLYTMVQKQGQDLSKY